MFSTLEQNKYKPNTAYRLIISIELKPEKNAAYENRMPHSKIKLPK